MQTQQPVFNGLVRMLSEEIQKLRSEKIPASNLSAIANASGKIISASKLELEYAKMTGVTPKLDYVNVSPNQRLLESSDKKTTKTRARKKGK